MANEAPLTFLPEDNRYDRAQKLNNVFSSLFRLIESLGVTSDEIEEAITSFGHTSEMPDSGGVNGDHDKRYFRKGIVKRMCGVNMPEGANQAAAGAKTGELWCDTSDGRTVKKGA